MITAPTIRKCSHGIYIGCNDEVAFHCQLCSPKVVEVVSTKIAGFWAGLLTEAGLFDPDNKMFPSSGKIVYECDGPQVEPNEEGFQERWLENQTTCITWTAVDHRESERTARPDDVPVPVPVKGFPAVWFAATIVPDLFARLTPLRKRTVEMHVLQGMTWLEISKELKVTPKAVAQNYWDAIKVMQKPTGIKFTTNRKCEVCGKGFKVTRQRGKPQRYCGDNCNAIAYRTRKKEAVKVTQVYPPIPATLHPVQLYPPYAGLYGQTLPRYQ